MTTAEQPFAQGRNPRFDKIATRLAHYTPAMWLVVAMMFVAGPWLIPRGLSFWQSVAWGFIPLVPTIALFFLTVAVESWHIYALCDICARKTPLDPAAKVAQKRRSLRLLHWVADKHAKAWNRVMPVLLLSVFIPFVGYVTFPLGMVFMAVMTYVQMIHRPLQPWCPQCRGRWGDGGSPEVAPTPDPVMENTR